MESINQTVVLIPKVASLEELGQFRAIILCNYIFKIASMVLTKRLKVCLPDAISEEQSAFVLEWLITYNIITAYESLHLMKRSRTTKHRSCALKIDMCKSYDRLEWRYLEAVMHRIGFHRLWV
jgi:hypothetical protein